MLFCWHRYSPPSDDRPYSVGGYRWTSQGLGGLEFGLSKALYIRQMVKLLALGAIFSFAAGAAGMVRQLCRASDKMGDVPSDAEVDLLVAPHARRSASRMSALTRIRSADEVMAEQLLIGAAEMQFVAC